MVIPEAFRNNKSVSKKNEMVGTEVFFGFAPNRRTNKESRIMKTRAVFDCQRFAASALVWADIIAAADRIRCQLRDASLCDLQVDATEDGCGFVVLAEIAAGNWQAVGEVRVSPHFGISPKDIARRIRRLTEEESAGTNYF